MDRRLIRIRRQIRAWLISAGLAMVVVITAVGLLGSTLARTAPGWWRLYRPSDELRERATAVENAAVSQLYLQRPADPQWLSDPDPGPWRSAPWSVALKDEDASAWLTTRLPEWIDGQADLNGWPDALDQPQVHFAMGLIRIGVLLHGEDRDRFLTASVRPEIREDGSLWLRTNWIHVGRLPLPPRFLLARAGSRLDEYLPDTLADDPHSAGFVDILRGNAPLAVKPEMRLEDGRIVRLLGLRVREGRIEFDCRTETSRTLAKQ